MIRQTIIVMILIISVFKIKKKPTSHASNFTVHLFLVNLNFLCRYFQEQCFPQGFTVTELHKLAIISEIMKGLICTSIGLFNLSHLSKFSEKFSVHS